jgi:hypothetical protein
MISRTVALRRVPGEPVNVLDLVRKGWRLVKGHRTRVLLLVGAATMLLTLVFSPAASASYVTKIMWGNPSIDVWAFKPATAGAFTYSVTWTDPFTNQKPDWPVATGQIVTMIDDGTGSLSQPYGNDLYDGTQQGTTVSPLQSKSITVTAGAIGSIYYFIAEAYDQNVKYDFTLNWAPKTGAPLLDVCGAGAHNKLLTGVAAESNFPATADPTGTTNPWLNVMGPWPPAPAAFSDNFLANYDAYMYETDYKAIGATYVENYTVGGYYSGTTIANQPSDGYNVAAAPYDGHTYGGGKYFAPTPGQNVQLAPSLWFPAVLVGGIANAPTGTTGSTWLQPGEAPVGTNIARLTSYSRTRSPIWNTWGYPTTNPGDLATNSVPGYLWAPVDDAAASKESYATENSTTASVSNRFYSDGTNPGVIWVHSTGPAGGWYNIFIDGTKVVSNGDNYSAAMVYKVQTPINGIALGYHTIMVQSAGAKTTASTGYNLYHDAFYGWDSPKWTNPGNVAPLTFIWTCERGFDSTYYDMQNNSDGFTTYKWGQVTDTVTAGGPHKLAASAQTNAAAALTFTGSTIQIQYLTGPHAGIFDVYVDGLRVSPALGLDGYKAAPAAYTTWTSGTLGARTNNVHTVLVVVKGTKHGSSDGYMVYLDWFTPGGTAPVSSKVEAELP